MEDAAPGPSLFWSFVTASVVAFAAAPPAFRRRVIGEARRLIRDALTPAPARGDLSRKYPNAIDVP